MEHNHVPDASYPFSSSGDPIGFDIDHWVNGQSSVLGSFDGKCLDFQHGYCHSGKACPYSHAVNAPFNKCDSNGFDSNGFDDDHMIWKYDLDTTNEIKESISSEIYSFAEDPSLNGRINPVDIYTTDDDLNPKHSPIIFPEWNDSPSLSSPTISPQPSVLPNETNSRSEPSSSSNAAATTAKRPRTQFSESARAILENALALELYPDPTEIASIAQRAQLSPQQVRTWFGNQRSRKSPKTITSAPSPIIEQRQQRDVSIPRSRSHPSPLTRRSLEDLQSEQGSPTSSKQSAPSSAGSSVTSRISGVTITSATSVQSVITCISRSSRKGRRKFPSPFQKPMEKKKDDSTWPDKAGKFRCSFCEQAFTTRYAWKRHEETLHLQLHQWKCKMARSCEDATTGSAQLDAEMFPPHIQELDTKAVQAWYNASVCAGGTSDDKCTFFRKDNLVQHLRQVHKVDLSRRGADLLDVWKDEMPAFTLEAAALACPYCPRFFGQWDERVKHVEQHFHREPEKERIPRSKTCPYCFEHCGSDEERLSHIETHTHGSSSEVVKSAMSPVPEEEKKNPENYYQCNYPGCVESRADIGSLVKHIAEHLKPQVLMTMCGQFRCRSCLVMFPEVRNLLAHIVLAHTDASLYRCHCACSFSSPDGLAQHVRYTHLDALATV